MDYRVKLEIFEGPLDLLLYLIRKNEVDICNIPIAKITEQYLGYLNVIKMLDLNNIGDFLVMASTLMHIKSNMLLPQEEKKEEEQEEEDPREELVNRLLEYRKFKNAAGKLKKLKHKEFNSLTRKSNFKEKISVPVQYEANVFDLIEVFKNVMKEVPEDVMEGVIRDEVTVDEKSHELMHLLAKKPKLYFTLILRRSKSKMEIIATFLAILELIRLKEVVVCQSETFGEIEIIRNEKHRLSSVS